MADFHSLPVCEAGCRMPSHTSIQKFDESCRMSAKYGSERLLLAMLRYGAGHGLPNIAAADCRARLEGAA